MRDRERMILLVTLCASLFAAVVGIIVLMLCGKNVAAPVSIAIAGEWGAALAVYARSK